MSKFKKMKSVFFKQFDEYEKPIKLYKDNHGFKKVVDYTEDFLKLKIDENAILIIGTENISNNMESLIKVLLEKYSNKKITLALGKNSGYYNKNITIIEKESKEYLNKLSSSKIIIVDGLIPNYFIKKSEQKVIQLPDLLSGRYDEESKFDTNRINIQRGLFQTSHIIFKSRDEAECYIELFNLKNIYKGKIFVDQNIYFSNKISEVPNKIDLLVLTKKYSQDNLDIILEKANNLLSNYWVYVHPELYKYYERFSELKYILIDQKISKEDLNLHDYNIISDNYTDLIGERNYYFQMDNCEFQFLETEKQIYIENYDIIEKIIDEKDTDFIKIDNTKQNLIMYCGGFLHNGITSSAINLSHSIDYDLYNLIIIDKGNLGEVERYNLNRLHPKANIIYRIGQSNITFTEYRKNQFILQRRGFRKYLGKRDLRTLYRRELKRLIGDVDVDVAIDFSGYVPFWTAMFAFSKARKKVIYQHNDLKSETEKVIDGKFKHRYILPRVFSLYKFYDKIVSVSLQTKELNAKNLSQYAPYRKFDYINNQINFNDILIKINESEEKKVISIENNQYYVVNDLNNNFILEPKDIEDKTIKLITIGRLSPEKDHHKLFLAIRKLLDEKPDTKITLNVLGSGIMEDELKKLINQLELTNYINMMGQVSNPYLYLNEADCFILSSNHEGQPMVLLESLALHKPIIATDIVGNRGVLEGTNGLLVENSIEGLKNGIKKLLDGEVKENNQFDINDYNNASISRFYEKVCK